MKLKNNEEVEIDVPSILNRDGILNSNFENENSPICNVKDIISSQKNESSWCYRVVNTENNSATIISQLPGEGNRRHYHPEWNEWWFIIDGEWKWEIEDEEFIVKKNDIVFMEKGKVHCITAIGDKPAIRLAVSREDVPHIYTSKK
jgi:mannose-6-phosphate isomerase-like protein (cupin superfamily)